MADVMDRCSRPDELQADIYNDHLHANMKQGRGPPLRRRPQRAIST